MKSIKTICITLGVTVATIFIFAHATPSFNDKGFALKCYLFILSPEDNVTWGSSDQLKESSFKNLENWGLTTLNPVDTDVCDPTHYLCAICFNDSEYTLTQALNAAWNYYIINHIFIDAQDVDPTIRVIKIYLRDEDQQTP